MPGTDRVAVLAYPCACPKCGADVGERCRAIDKARPGPLQIIHRERREAQQMLPDQMLEALDW